MKKGIFCLEGLWHDDLRNRSTVEPVLDLLELNSDIPFLHSDCATRVEFEFYIKKWIKNTYNRYPILYLAFHGLENGILIDKEPFTLDEFSSLLEGKCKNRVFVFASCSTIKTDRRNLKRFLKKTNALAICGYRRTVPWIMATAFELILLSTMQDNSLDGRGINAIYQRVNDVSAMFRQLDFLMLTNKDL